MVNKRSGLKDGTRAVKESAKNTMIAIVENMLTGKPIYEIAYACTSTLHMSDVFLSTTELNKSVEYYNSSRVGVACRVSNFKDRIISKRFEL